ncbi:ATP-binding protein, partial [Phenylobacterium sp.]|uniref:ATP-binding protein n=1 Tax=Phenylobacterium sp. TaxID=1871053 RepID=UPI0019CCF0D5
VGCALRQDGAFAVFEVANAGPTMPPEQAEAILKPFVRGRSGGGVGLGLALVQECASRHGGALSLHSPPAGGAVFALRFPLDAAEEAEPPPSPDG